MCKEQEINKLILPTIEFNEDAKAIFDNNEENSEDKNLYSEEAMDCAFFDNHPELKPKK